MFNFKTQKNEDIFQTKTLRSLTYI